MYRAAREQDSLCMACREYGLRYKHEGVTDHHVQVGHSGVALVLAVCWEHSAGRRRQFRGYVLTRGMLQALHIARGWH